MCQFLLNKQNFLINATYVIYNMNITTQKQTVKDHPCSEKNYSTNLNQSYSSE